ncbi:MAG: hypothetical protein MRERV_5c006 [Mycoplasmataceae bacterium RV_VA103A]|nr:MAG: hypothetical protein MRERV_5c006 [Mycoplasmataceae bacterium RV_VA103A]
MVNNNYGIPIEVNKKPFELVYEIENQNDYQSNWLDHCWKAVEASGIVNKSLLKSLNPESYTFYCSSCSGSNGNLNFKLRIVLKNCMGGLMARTVYNTENARKEANNIIAESGFWEDKFLEFYSREDRKKLFSRIIEKINYHDRGNSVDAAVCNKDRGRSPITSANVSINELDDYWQLHEDCMYGAGGYSGAERSGRGGFLD